MNEHIVIVTGDTPIASSIVERIPPSAIVLGVDSGLDHALAAGLRPNGLIGDLDSVSDEGRAWAEEHATISSHSADKNQTDTELAVAFATAMTPSHLTLIGGGDRLDHTLAALGTLVADSVTSIPRIDAWWDGQHIDALHGPGRYELALEPGSTLSLVVLGRPADGVTITGVRWPLEESRLGPVLGHGVSNEVTADDGVVNISLSNGVLTVFDVPLDEPPTASPLELSLPLDPSGTE